jgi:PTS system mannose-specific IIA component
MIKILIASHGNLGQEYLRTLELIVGRKGNIDVIQIDTTTPLDALKGNVENSLDKDAGTIVITDMFGGTPSNISIPYLSEGKVEIVFGLNLPMLITAVNKREKLKLSELAEAVAKSGRDSIFRALDILKAR